MIRNPHILRQCVKVAICKIISFLVKAYFTRARIYFFRTSVYNQYHTSHTYISLRIYSSNKTLWCATNSRHIQADLELISRSQFERAHVFR